MVEKGKNNYTFRISARPLTRDYLGSAFDDVQLKLIAVIQKRTYDQIRRRQQTLDSNEFKRRYSEEAGLSREVTDQLVDLVINYYKDRNFLEYSENGIYTVVAYK